MSLPMMRVLIAVCCALLAAWALVAEAQQLPRGRGPGSRAPGGGNPTCPAFPATCQINAPVFNFGRHTMAIGSPPVLTQGLISVTCTRHPQDRLEVTVGLELKALVPDAPPRYMRDAGGGYLAYDLYLDPARTRLFGDGTNGTFTISNACLLDERNRVCTLAIPLFGKAQAVEPPLPGQWLGAVVTRVEYSFSGCIP